MEANKAGRTLKKSSMAPSHSRLLPWLSLTFGLGWSCSAVEEEVASETIPIPNTPSSATTGWPFLGDQQAQGLFHNYTQPVGNQIHAGQDFLQPAGTPVRALAGGWIAAYGTWYPENAYHHYLVVSEEQGGDEGWCYVHLDPSTVSFPLGHRVEPGDVLGRIVSFQLGLQKAPDHLHLAWVRLQPDGKGKNRPQPIADPFSRLPLKDRIPPSFAKELIVVSDGGLDTFSRSATGLPQVWGKVDLLVGIQDLASPEQKTPWMASKVQAQLWRQDRLLKNWCVLDHRQEIGDRFVASVLYVHRSKVLAWPEERHPFHWLRITNSDGDGRLESEDATFGWNSAALDQAGKRLFPPGEYRLVVQAWDWSGNLGEAQFQLEVLATGENAGRRP